MSPHVFFAIKVESREPCRLKLPPVYVPPSDIVVVVPAEPTELGKRTEIWAEAPLRFPTDCGRGVVVDIGPECPRRIGRGLTVHRILDDVS
jgi:hypothetical protein